MSASPIPLPRSKRLLLRVLNVYPPFFGARIRVRRLAGGGFETRLRLVLWNRNFVGTHFGGSLYAMTDPFYVLLLYERLGSGYTIWNRQATIDFVKPGRGVVTARFELTDDRVDEIRRAAASGDKIEPRFLVKVMDKEGEAVARIEQTLYVRRRPSASAAT